MLKLISFLVVSLVGLAASDRLASQQQAAMPAQAPGVVDMPLQAPTAVCDCGPHCQCPICLCDVQSVVAVAESVAPVDTVAIYYKAALAASVASKGVLVVGIGTNAPEGAGFVTVRTNSLDGYSPGDIVVSKGGYWVKTLPTNASPADVLAAANPPQSAPQFSSFQGGCQGGQCGMGFTGFMSGGCAGGNCGGPAGRRR